MTAVDIVILCLASFCGIVGISLSGFEMAILYFFVWQICTLFAPILPETEYSDDFKFVAFIQALALVSAQPFLLYDAQIRKANFRVLSCCLPPLLLCTPLGQHTADIVSTDTVRTVGGFLITVVAMIEIYKKRGYFSSCLERPTQKPVVEIQQWFDQEWFDEESGITREITLGSSELSDDYFEKRFSVTDKVLGKGSFSSVFAGYDRLQEAEVAVKVTEKVLLTDDEYHALTREMSILRCLGEHPNIVHNIFCWDAGSTIYMVNEKMNGGDLVSKLSSVSHFPEHRAQGMMKSVLKAVTFLHDIGIAHRDIKLDNILFDDKSNHAVLKITDFGFAKHLPRKGWFHTMCGTLSYCAPEVLLGKPYNLKADMWSIGVLAYTLLAGYFPFRNESQSPWNQMKHVVYDEQYWSSISSEGKSFVSSLLQYNQSKRLSAETVVNHFWFSKALQPPNSRITSNQQVVFMIGSQRSGSNWLRTMLEEREDLASPHPPHIMRDFMPIIDKFGNLDDEENFRILVDHVCTFVENNQVPWLDKHDCKISFDRMKVLVMAASSRDRLLHEIRDNESEQELSSTLYLLCVFDAIMCYYTDVNARQTWICKSMGMSKFHNELLQFYGKKRLRYIYLVRDPRDVAMSFMKTPVGDCHYYPITKKWVSLQHHALRIIEECPSILHKVHYESILSDKEAVIADIYDFIGERRFGGVGRQASVLFLKPVKECVNHAKNGRQTKIANKLSVQFENLHRGDSFLVSQHEKWKQPENKLGMKDIHMIESIAHEVMVKVGYELQLVGKCLSVLKFKPEDIKRYEEENIQAIERMHEDLKKKAPEDFERRAKQANVLSQPPKLLSEWSNADAPINAQSYLSTIDFDVNLHVQKSQYVKMKSSKFSRSLQWGCASQKGYHPCKPLKPNQDKFSESTLMYKNNANLFFGVYDGHGEDGHMCASYVSDNLPKKLDSLFQGGCSLLSRSTQSNELSPRMLTSIAKRALTECHMDIHRSLESSEVGIDTTRSGTTSISILLQSYGECLVSNLGDSSCILGVRSGKNKVAGEKINKPHDLKNAEERKRVGKTNAVIMTAEEMADSSEDYDTSGVLRIWHKDANLSPGVAFTRSIGDKLAHNLGVIAHPDIIELKIEDSHRYLILCSDGVTDCLSAQECVEIVSGFTDSCEAAAALVRGARAKWIQRDESMDDITATVIFFEAPKLGPRLLKKLLMKRPDESKPVQISKVYGPEIVSTSDIHHAGTLVNGVHNDETFGIFAIICTIFAVGVTGFLGGLCGIQDPPLILYFLYPPHPISFDTITQRATCASITGTIAISRVVYYLVDALALGRDKYFAMNNLLLYCCVILSSLLGACVGSHLLDKIEDSKETIRGVLSLLLLISGVGLLLSSIAA